MLPSVQAGRFTTHLLRDELRPVRIHLTRARVSGANRCYRKFLRYYPGGFFDKEYLALERNYKWKAHEQWTALLAKPVFRELLRNRSYKEAADRAVRIEARTNLLFSFEKMALRDAVKTTRGARRFAEGLFDFCYGASALDRRFGRWVEAVAGLPRRQTRVLTWPVLTIFPFIALPEEHFFLKPNVTRIAFSRYGLAFDYASKPAWPTYASLLAGAARVATDLRRLNPRDMMDIQGFLWVQGSQEYPDE